MKINTKLIAIAKNEGAYLPQWIYHHFSIGFDEIEIYINDTTDNSIAICEKIQKNHLICASWDRNMYVFDDNDP